MEKLNLHSEGESEYLKILKRDKQIKISKIKEAKNLSAKEMKLKIYKLKVEYLKKVKNTFKNNF